MKIRPLGNRIFVKRIEKNEKTSGGIIIPDTAKEKPMEGIVIAVGPGNYDDNGNRIPLSVNEGDRVVFGKWSGEDLEINNEEFVVLTEDNIIGVLK